MASKARGSQRAEERSKQRYRREQRWNGERARYARLRRRLKLRQGASPLRPRPPFPGHLIVQNGVNPSRVRKPRRSGAPLTDRLRSEERTGMRERGPCGQGPGTRSHRGRDGALRTLEALPQTPPGGKPPGTPMISLDTGRPSHGSRDRQGACPPQTVPLPFQHQPAHRPRVAGSRSRSVRRPTRPPLPPRSF